MTTIVLADSRLKGIESERYFRDDSVHLNVVSGSKIKDHKRFVRNLRKNKVYKSGQRLLFVISVGINDIPDNLSDKSVSKRRKVFKRVTGRYQSLVKEINKFGNKCKIVIATVPPKDLRKCANKYPAKSLIPSDKITDEHQLEFSGFINKLNSYIKEYNEKTTQCHLPFHVPFRTHRGRRGSSKFYFHKLKDGIHARTVVKQTWFKKIVNLRRNLRFL